MTKNLRNRVLLVLGVVVASIYFAFPAQKRINLGLDLKGGMHLVLQVNTSDLKSEEKNDAVLKAIDILRNRIDSMGVGETVLQRQGENEILIQLPGITNRDEALALLGRVAQLEFRLVSDNPNHLRKALEGTIPAGYILKNLKGDANEPIILEDTIALKGDAVSDARVDFDSSGFGQPYISLQFNTDGAKAFAKLTRDNVGRRLAIIIDNEVLSAPNINEPILGGKGQITGTFTFEEASILSRALRHGSLPAPIIIEEERTIGPLLGKESIVSGIKAAIIGGILVFAFMLIYYLTAGVVSNIALMLNLLMIFGIMGFLNVMLPNSPLVLTLPGIAGIILTLGMAVDANVLINERIREELQNGQPIKAAINNGFSKALKAIIDSNATTLIAAFMLFQFGSGPIKGFAVTLTLGLISSLFTAIFVTRTLFNILLELKFLKKLTMLSFFTDTNIDFVAKRYYCYALSTILIIGSIFILAKKKDAAYGIDFAGGQFQEYKFEKPIEADVLRAALEQNGIKDAIIQQFEKNPENIIVRTSGDTYDNVVSTFKNVFPDNVFEILRIEKVGPVVGKNLRHRAVLAIIFALAGILVFVGFRFKHFDFAAAGVIALIHDVFVSLGIVVMMGREIDLLVITALLTIAGYSINDTIIIYDRVRENSVKLRKKPLADIINISVNQTLGRTILTTITTLFVVVTLFLKGGEVLNTFALCLMIGFIAGTYSTIFIASPLVLAWQKK